LDYEEDSSARVDSNVTLTKSGKIVDFQTTAEGEPYEKAQMLELFEVASNGISQIIDMYDNV
jgi:ribonuclease PH